MAAFQLKLLHQISVTVQTCTADALFPCSEVHYKVTGVDLVVNVYWSGSVHDACLLSTATKTAG